MINRVLEEKTYRAVCPHCLRTFIATQADFSGFCWKCGQHIILISGEEIIDSRNNQTIV